MFDSVTMMLTSSLTGPAGISQPDAVLHAGNPVRIRRDTTSNAMREMYDEICIYIPAMLYPFNDSASMQLIQDYPMNRADHDELIQDYPA